MVIYADIIFFINFISSYTMLYILGRFINVVKIKKIRLIAAAFVGGISALCVVANYPTQLVIRIISTFLMILISYFELRKRILQQILWFILMSGIMMFSMIMIASVMSCSTGLEIRSGILYFDLPVNIFLPIFIVSYVVMIFFVKMFKNRKNKKYYIITVTHNDKTVTVPALFDSGNSLKEPITGKYVSVLEWEYARKLFDAKCSFEELCNVFEDMKLWAVPFHSVGNTGGIMFAFLADEISIHEEGKVIEKTFVGLCERKLSHKGEYHALLNAGLL